MVSTPKKETTKIKEQNLLIPASLYNFDFYFFFFRLLNVHKKYIIYFVYNNFAEQFSHQQKKGKYTKQNQHEAKSPFTSSHHFPK